MPAKQPQFDPQYVDEHHQRISEFAADYFDDDEEREAFVDTLMDRRGYVRQNSWGPPVQPDPQQQPPNGGQPPRQSKTPYFKR